MEKASVLIVEDEVLIARDIRKSLEEMGHSVTAVASSAEDAIKSVEDTRPDMLLMDIALPGEVDGIAAASIIRSRFNVPSLYLTSYSDEKTLQRAKATRPLGYLIKPFEERELKLAIEMALYKHRAEEDLRKANRALKTLSSCNSAMSHSAGEQELLDEICRVIVDLGGYDLAWVGLITGKEDEIIRPASLAGDDRGSLKDRELSLRVAEIGQGPIGEAIRTTIPVSLQQSPPGLCREFPGIESINPGYASWIALPLVSERRVLGVLNIHSSEPNAFDTDEFDLLVELANNLAYGIVSFRHRAERRRVHELVGKSEEKYKNLVELTTDLIYQFDTEGALTFVNDSALSMLDVLPGEAAGTPFMQWIHPEDREKTLRHFSRTAERGMEFLNFENRLLSGNGRVTYVLHNIRVLRDDSGKVTGTQGIARDITKRRSAEEALFESEETLRTITGTASDAIVMIDDGGRVSFWNSAAEKTFGYSYGEIIGREIHLVIAPEKYHEPHKEGLYNFRKSGTGPVMGKTLELSARKRDGSEIPVEMSLSSIQVKGKWHAVAVMRDISERKDVERQLKRYREQLEEIVGERTAELKKEITERERAEAEVRERENMLRTLFEEALNPVMITNDSGRFIDANRAALEFLELSRGELLNADIWSLLSPEGMDHPGSGNPPPFEGKPLETPYSVNGKTKTLLLNIVAVTVADKNVLYFIGQEITERKKLLEEMMKAQKLESVGVLAGGIAHDFNNILTAVLSNISLAKLSSEEGSKTSGLLEEAERASFRARDLTQQLLTFSRGGAPVKKTASIPQLLRESADFALRGSNVRCEYRIQEDLWPVDIDEGQISQAVSNLVINADHAMPEGGRVIVRAKNVNIGKNELPNLKKGRYVEVCVEDRGTGIPEKHLDKIFDPYFTTKQEGSGLGLASTYSVIKNHGGYITVESEMGGGAGFRFYLPASRHKLRAPREAKDRIYKGKGKILVMDDDEDVRDSVGEALRLFGYQVAFASDGEETIDLYKKEKDSGSGFDAVIMDLTIPGGMGGAEAVKKLRKINPTLKALVSSGYSNSPVMSDYGKYGFSGVILKPYKIEDLSRVLHLVISKKQPEKKRAEGRT